MAGHNNNKQSQDQLGQVVPHLFMTPNINIQTPGVDVAYNNGASASPSHRPRGRPLGSKNKPKARVIVTQDIPNAYHAQMFEIPAGVDVVKALFDYANRREKGLSILSGNGMVEHVMFRQPEESTMTLHGRFEILSISGMILPKSGTILPSPATPGGVGGLVVYLAGGLGGQVIGGCVVSPLVALTPVVLVAASFANPVLEKLPLSYMDQPVATPQSSSAVVATRLAAEGGVSVPLFSVDGSTGRRNMMSLSDNPHSGSVPGHLFGWAVTTATTITTSNVTAALPSNPSPF